MTNDQKIVKEKSKLVKLIQKKNKIKTLFQKAKILKLKLQETDEESKIQDLDKSLEEWFNK